jgi:predicted dehydrogenase
MKKELPHICFLGCGSVAAKHAAILKKLYPSIHLSFASRDAGKSKEYVQKFKGKFAFGSYKAAINSNVIDIIFITTPHAYHSELAVYAADKKKDIIIEKPVTRTLKEFREIEAAVKRNEVRCAVAENYFFKPIIGKIRKHIENGDIGNILFIEVNKTNREKVSGWRTDAKMMGGGALLEGGVHWINFLNSVAGSKPSGVIAFKPEFNYISNIPFEDTIMINLKYVNGSVGRLLHSWNIMNPLKGIGFSKIYGTDGNITFESNGLYYSVRGKKKKKGLISPFDFLGFKAMHRSFMEAYINDQPWEPSLNIIKRDLIIVDKAYKSLKSGKIEAI